MLVLSGFTINPVLWAIALSILLIHELGHAFIVRRCGCTVMAIDLHAAGGACQWAGYATSSRQAMIAWGGILAQGALVALCEIVARLLPAGTVVAEVLPTIQGMNLLVIGFNLLPVPGLDGLEAWKLFRWQHLKQLSDWLRRRKLSSRAKTIERELSGVQKQRDKKHSVN